MNKITNEQVKEDIECLKENIIYYDDNTDESASMYISIKNITQHIANQDARIKELEDEISIFNMLDMKLIAEEYRNKLDKIKEECNKKEKLGIEKITGAYINGRNSLRNKIKSILKENE